MSEQITISVNKAPTTSLLQDTTAYWAQFLMSLTHDLLSLPRYGREYGFKYQETSQMAMREATRIAALIFVSTVICRCSGDELYCARNYQGRAREMLIASNDSDWIGLEELRLWTLVLCAMIEDDRTWYVEQIKQLMQECKLDTWDEVLRILRQIAWIDSLTAVEAATLALEVEECLKDDTF